MKILKPEFELFKTNKSHHFCAPNYDLQWNALCVMIFSLLNISGVNSTKFSRKNHI